MSRCIRLQTFPGARLGVFGRRHDLTESTMDYAQMFEMGTKNNNRALIARSEARECQEQARLSALAAESAKGTASYAEIYDLAVNDAKCLINETNEIELGIAWDAARASWSMGRPEHRPMSRDAYPSCVDSATAQMKPLRHLWAQISDSDPDDPIRVALAAAYLSLRNGVVDESDEWCGDSRIRGGYLAATSFTR